MWTGECGYFRIRWRKIINVIWRIRLLVAVYVSRSVSPYSGVSILALNLAGSLKCSWLSNTLSGFSCLVPCVKMLLCSAPGCSNQWGKDPKFAFQKQNIGKNVATPLSSWPHVLWCPALGFFGDKFLGIDCALEAETSVSNLTQYKLFIGDDKKICFLEWPSPLKLSDSTPNSFLPKNWDFKIPITWPKCF